MNYNRRAYLQAAIDGARRQALEDQEIIVLDGGSTDGSVSWLSEHLLPNERLIELGGNPGPVALMNTGIRAARGRLIAFLEMDDFWLPGYLKSMASAFASNAVQWASSGCAIINERDQIVNLIGANGSYSRDRNVVSWENDPLFLKLIGRCPHGLLSLSMARKSIFAKIGGFDPAYRWTGMELDFICRLALARGRKAFAFVDRILGVRRHHSKQLTNVPGPWHWEGRSQWNKRAVRTRMQREFYLDLSVYFARYRDAIQRALI